MLKNWQLLPWLVCGRLGSQPHRALGMGPSTLLPQLKSLYQTLPSLQTQLCVPCISQAEDPVPRPAFVLTLCKRRILRVCICLSHLSPTVWLWAFCSCPLSCHLHSIPAESQGGHRSSLESRWPAGREVRQRALVPLMADERVTHHLQHGAGLGPQEQMTTSDTL